LRARPAIVVDKQNLARIGALDRKQKLVVRSQRVASVDRDWINF